MAWRLQKEAGYGKESDCLSWEMEVVDSGSCSVQAGSLSSAAGSSNLRKEALTYRHRNALGTKDPALLKVDVNLYEKYSRVRPWGEKWLTLSGQAARRGEGREPAAMMAPSDPTNNSPDKCIS